MPDIDAQLRSNWQSLNRRIDRLEERVNTHSFRYANSRIGKLRRTSLRLIILGLLSTLFSIPLYTIVGTPLWIAITYVVLLLVMAGINVHLYRLYDTIDISSCTFVDARRKVARVIGEVHRCRLVGYVLGAPFIATLLYVYYAISPDVFYGGVVGAVIGFAIGISIEIKIERWLREIMEQISSDSEQTIEE